MIRRLATFVNEYPFTTSGLLGIAATIVGFVIEPGAWVVTR